MMRKLIAIFLIALTGACSSIPTAVKDAATSTDVLAGCMVADVITTSIALNSGKFVEANPILKPFIGPHNFVPLILVSTIVWFAIWKLNEPKATMVANVIKCGVVGHNLAVMHGAGIMH